MAFTFSDLKAEVKRRATRDQGGTQFDIGIMNTINTSLWRVAREAKWRSLRRSTAFDTVTRYTTGTGAVAATNGSKSITVTGATFLTNGIRIGRYVTFSGSQKYFKIATITGETTLTINENYDGTTTTTGTYAILGQEEYVLPIQCSHQMFLWHKAYGYPCALTYSPSHQFYSSGATDTDENIPIAYRMWGQDSTLDRLRAASVVTVVSSSASDTSIPITVFGVVSGYPDYEVINTNGTTPAAGSKSFTSVERVVKSQSTAGRVTVTANTGSTTVSVLPVGNTTTAPVYSRIQLYPLPNAVIPINVNYYKLPFQLVNDGDVHELGEDFNEAIILLSVAKLKAEQNQKEDADFYKFYQDEISSLKKTNIDKPDWFPQLQRPNDYSSFNFDNDPNRGRTVSA